jgi:hypothetical protein
MQVKSADAVAKKWAARAGAAGADYSAGVNGTTKDWATETGNASAAWQAGVTTAAGNGSFKKGVDRVGTGKWKAKASSVGAQRYPAGVQAATPFYQTGIGPVLQTLAALTLPPRGPKGDPGNLNRVRVVTEALRKLKTG